MAPLKKRLSRDFFSSPAPSSSSSSSSSSSAPASKKVKAANDTPLPATSPVAVSFAPATKEESSSSAVSLPPRSATPPNEARVGVTLVALPSLSGAGDVVLEIGAVPSPSLSSLSEDSSTCGRGGETDPSRGRSIAGFPPLPFAADAMIVGCGGIHHPASEPSSPRDMMDPLYVLSRVSSRIAVSAAIREETTSLLARHQAEQQSDAPDDEDDGDEDGCYSGVRRAFTRRPHGMGVATYPNGCRYAGQFANDGMRHGHGKCWYPRDLGVYTGQWHMNVKHGVGCMVYANGDVYNGTWRRNLHDGSGTLTSGGGRGEVYVGDFADNRRHGRGVITYEGGDAYSGTWYNDLRHGEGMIMFANGGSSRRVYYHGKLVYPESDGGSGM